MCVSDRFKRLLLGMENRLDIQQVSSKNFSTVRIHIWCISLCLTNTVPLQHPLFVVHLSVDTEVFLHNCSIYVRHLQGAFNVRDIFRVKVLVYVKYSTLLSHFKGLFT